MGVQEKLRWKGHVAVEPWNSIDDCKQYSAFQWENLMRSTDYEQLLHLNWLLLSLLKPEADHIRSVDGIGGLIEQN